MWQFIGKISIKFIYWNEIYLYSSKCIYRYQIQKSAKRWKCDIISVINNIFTLIGSIIELNWINYVTKCVRLLMKQCMYILSKYIALFQNSFLFLFRAVFAFVIQPASIWLFSNLIIEIMLSLLLFVSLVWVRACVTWWLLYAIFGFLHHHQTHFRVAFYAQSS